MRLYSHGCGVTPSVRQRTSQRTRPSPVSGRRKKFGPVRDFSGVGEILAQAAIRSDESGWGGKVIMPSRRTRQRSSSRHWHTAAIRVDLSGEDECWH